MLTNFYIELFSSCYIASPNLISNAAKLKYNTLRLRKRIINV